ncbi:MAG TPA: cbb3-type cytochrome c oxidase N-terminal domain-containing protein, partial [Roseivirga sp.]
YAQTETGSGMSQEIMLYITLGLVFMVSILVLVVAVYVLQLLKAFIQKEMSPESLARLEEHPSWFTQLWDKWNALKPLEQEEELLLDHNYDGIKELDNHLPPWWKGLFYVTIVYAVIYVLIFHVFKTAPLQEERYANEVASAEALQASKAADIVVDFDENTVTASTDAGELADGKKFFESQCAVCHKADGGGLAGPNLTDKYWKHGGAMTDVYKVIKNGVPNTAMMSWEKQLNPVRIRNVASYVLSLQGTNPQGGLPPDGQLYEPENQ